MVCSTPALAPPNGGMVTNAKLYEALYALDQRLADRDTVMLGTINRQREDFSNHIQDGHPFTQSAEIVKEEIKLDAKKAGIVAGALALMVALSGLVSAVIDKLFPWGAN